MFAMSGRGQCVWGLTTLGPAHDQKMTSPYLEQPLVPLGVALPQMLENVEADLANEKLEPAEKSRLRQRVELIRRLSHRRTSISAH